MSLARVQRQAGWVSPLLLIAAIVGAWEAAVRVSGAPLWLLPAPERRFAIPCRGQGHSAAERVSDLLRGADRVCLRGCRRRGARYRRLPVPDAEPGALPDHHRQPDHPDPGPCAAAPRLVWVWPRAEGDRHRPGWVLPDRGQHGRGSPLNRPRRGQLVALLRRLARKGLPAGGVSVEPAVHLRRRQNRRRHLRHRRGIRRARRGQSRSRLSDDPRYRSVRDAANGGGNRLALRS